ncbi:mammalian ependymin-related protein 1-like [Oscarella lobularis]|uniref:mammalian ependymin-related protein 1-like n=1 Tax=Oscarella lobularis TaxID=121494 RepID=UPI00331332EE
MFSVQLLLVLFAFAHSSTTLEPQKCTSPSTLQGKETSFDYERRFEREALWVYDADREAVAWYETVDLNSTRAAYHDIWLWKERAWFRFNIRTRQCTRRELTLPFAILKVPSNAQFIASRYLGSSAAEGENLLVNVWVAQDEDVWSKYNSERVFTDADCLPVYVAKFRPTSVERSTFFNLTRTISRPDLFVPPEECAQ